LTAHGKEKKASLEKKIEDIKEQIATFTPGVYKAGDFDWMVDFAEIMADGGFDIQVANPPYVRMELFKEIKSTLKKNFPEAHSDRSDLYCYFYARSLQLLKPGGMLAYISSNKWFRAGYGEKLRKHIADTCQIHSITDFGDLPVFKSATAYPMIFICSHQSPINRDSLFTQVKSLEHPYPNVREVIKQSGSILPSNAIAGGNWLLTDDSNSNHIKKMKLTGITLDEYVDKKIYRGVVTGFNEAFFIDNETRDKLIFENPLSEGIIKPLLLGKDIGKWHIKDKNRYLLYMYPGIDIRELGAVINYLKPYYQFLEKRAGRQQWYELQQPQQKYLTAFDQPKIVWGNLSLEPRFTLTSEPYYLSAPCVMIPTSDLYLLGILNSSTAKKFFQEIGIKRNGNYIEFKPIYVKQLLIPQASEIERKAISKLVQKCLDAKGVGCEAWEKEIDIRVAKLYGFDDNYDLN
jgi:TaqI-like C-terminal specificity domain/Eco57I restriction-modification methylase